MRIAVVGGTGFTGTAIAEEALARGHEVVALHRGRRGAPSGARGVIRAELGFHEREGTDARMTRLVATLAQSRQPNPEEPKP